MFSVQSYQLWDGLWDIPKTLRVCGEFAPSVRERHAGYLFEHMILRPLPDQGLNALWLTLKWIPSNINSSSFPLQNFEYQECNLYLNNILTHHLFLMNYCYLKKVFAPFYTTFEAVLLTFLANNFFFFLSLNFPCKLSRSLSLIFWVSSCFVDSCWIGKLVCQLSHFHFTCKIILHPQSLWLS